jgi:cysteine desulfurase / selenocysteine lyase
MMQVKEKGHISTYRKDFPMLYTTVHGKQFIYLDSAATAQKPQVVINAICEFYQKYYGTVHRAVYTFSQEATRRYQDAREKLRAFIGAEKLSEIVFTRGTTDAINLVANSYGRLVLTPGDEVIISEIEHHSNLVPWQFICKSCRAKLKVAPVDEDGEIILEAYQELLSPRTKIVALTHVSNSVGTILPIKEMIEMAHQAGAVVVVDGAQAAAHMPIDVQELDADFYAFSGHKLYGPTGVGVLYGKQALLEAMPPFEGGGDMVDRVSFAETTFQKPPLKFEAGTPMIAEVIGLGAAIDYLTGIGMENILAWEHELFLHATHELNQISGVQILGSGTEKGAIISFTVEGVHPLDLATLLDLEGIAIRSGHQCTQNTMARFGISGAVRISFGLYNTIGEIDRFISALNKVIAILR